MKTYIVTVYNQKGGCGKTTMTMQLAGTLGGRGKKVLVVDMDAQATSVIWASQGDSEDGTKAFPARVMNLAAMGDNMHKEVKEYVGEYDYIFIDCAPGKESKVPRKACIISDLILIPLAPSPADFWATIAAKDMAQEVQETMNPELKIKYLINGIVPNTLLSRDIVQTIHQIIDPADLLSTQIGRRTAYEASQAGGTTVHNIANNKKAAEEMNALTNEILSILEGELIEQG